MLSPAQCESFNETLRALQIALMDISRDPHSGLNRARYYLLNILPRSHTPAFDAANTSGKLGRIDALTH